MRYDSHHLLWTRKNWNKGYAHRLRKLFVYELPMPLHQELHQKVEPIPVPFDCEELFIKYSKLGYKMDIPQAIEWLIRNSKDEAFRRAMKFQLDFLEESL